MKKSMKEEKELNTLIEEREEIENRLVGVKREN
jgi:hypothetical protein